MTAAPGAQPNFQTAKSSPRASEGKTPGLQAPRAPQAPTLKTSICTCAAPQPSPLLPPGARRGQGSAPRPAAALHPGAGRSPRGPPVPPGGLRARRPARKPRPRPPPDRTSASCSRWSRPPAPPRSSAGPPVPTWPWQRGGAASAENKERPRRRGGSVADVSGRRTQEQSVRGAQKVPEIPAPCASLPRPPRCGAPGESEPGRAEGRGRAEGPEGRRAAGVWAQEAGAREGAGPKVDAAGEGRGHGLGDPGAGRRLRLGERSEPRRCGEAPLEARTRPWRPGGVCGGSGACRGTCECSGWEGGTSAASGRPDASPRLTIITAVLADGGAE